MPIAFPPSPTVNETYTYGSHQWLWTGEGWRLNINAGQVGTGWQELGTAVVSVEQLPADLDKTTWLHKVYV
jgi:hypothetical protein